MLCDDLLREIAGYLCYDDIKKLKCVSRCVYDVYDYVEFEDIADGFRYHNMICNSITDNGIKDLPRTLTTLILYNCKLITNNGIKDLPRTLTTLNLCRCNLITDNGIKDLPRTLTTLDLSGCISITDNGIEDLRSSYGSSLKIYR